MKKLLIGIVLAATVLVTSAAEHRSYSLINPQAKAFIVAPGYGWTNLNYSGLATNMGLLRYTNYANTSVSVTANTNSFLMFNDAPAIPPYEAWPFSDKTHATTLGTNENAKANMTFSITHKALYGTGPIIVRLAPLIFDGQIGAPTATDIVAFSIPTATSAITTVFTNLPAGLFGSAKWVRVLDVSNTGSGSSNVVYDMRINGWEQ